MTDPENSPGEVDTLDRQALDWVEHLVIGDVTQDDVEGLKRWRAQGPMHEAAYRRACQMRKMLVDLDREEAADRAAGSKVVRIQSWARQKQTRRALLGGGLAASAAAVAAYGIISPPLGLWPSLAELGADYRTVTGQQSTVSLGPQVMAELNTQTSIAISRSGNEKGIRLIGGEAAITAALVEPATFRVIAGEGQASATRAKFNVRKDGDDICVTCVAGAVRVAQAGAAVILRTGQQVIYNNEAMQPVAAANIETVTAWQRGLLVFHDEPLSYVIAEVNRYRSGRIILADRGLGDRRVNANFHLSQINDVVNQVQELVGAKATYLTRNVVVLT